MDKILFKGPLEKPLSSAGQYLWISEKMEVIVFLVEGRVNVYPSLCPHMGAQLTRAGSQLFCPWHGLSFCTQKNTSEHHRYQRIAPFPAEYRNGELTIYAR